MYSPTLPINNKVPVCVCAVSYAVGAPPDSGLAHAIMSMN